MKISERGFSTPLALTVIFSLSITALAFSMLIAANEKRIKSYKTAVEEKKKIDCIIFDIEEKIQLLKDIPSDTDEQEISFLISSVCDYNFKVFDVSTGINKNFCRKDFLTNKAIDEYITASGDKAFLEYGWINPKFSDKEVLEQISKDFCGKSTYPLVNNLPPLNIHNMSIDFLTAVFKFCKIKEAEKKAEKVKERLSFSTGIKELSEILAVEENHMVFDLTGTKTVFWKVEFETKKAKAYAVFAAVPQKENQKKIEKYILVEKKAVFKEGL